MSRYLVRPCVKREDIPEARKPKPYRALSVIEFAGGNGAWVDYLFAGTGWLDILGFADCADEKALGDFCAAYPDLPVEIEPCGDLAGMLLGVVKPPMWLTNAVSPISAPEWMDWEEKYGDDRKAIKAAATEHAVEVYEKFEAAGLVMKTQMRESKRRDWVCIQGIITHSLADTWKLSDRLKVVSSGYSLPFGRLIQLGYSIEDAFEAFTRMGVIVGKDKLAYEVDVPGFDEPHKGSAYRAMVIRSTILDALLGDCDMDLSTAEKIIDGECSCSYILGLSYALEARPKDQQPKGLDARADLWCEVVDYFPDFYRVPAPEAHLAFQGIEQGYLLWEEFGSYSTHDELSACLDAHIGGVDLEDIFA